MNGKGDRQRPDDGSYQKNWEKIFGKKNQPIHPLASKLSLLKYELDGAGLHITAQRLDWALVAIGFEIAKDFEGLEAYEAQRDGSSFDFLKDEPDLYEDS